MKNIQLISVVFFAALFANVCCYAQQNQCLERTDSVCRDEPSATLIISSTYPNSFPVYLRGSTISVQAVMQPKQGTKADITTYSDCSQTEVDVAIDPSFVSGSWEAAGPDSLFTASGTGLSAIFAATHGTGTGTITFHLTYSIPDPCAATRSTSLTVHFQVVDSDITEPNCGSSSSTRLAYWNFDDMPTIARWSGENNPNDSCGTYDGTIQGNVSFVSGHSGQGFGLDGTGGEISFGNQVGNFGTNDYTIDFWIKTSSNGKQAVLGKRPICGESSMWDVRMDNGYLWFECRDGVNDCYLITQNQINDGAFHRVTITRGGNTVAIYIDNNLDSSQSLSGIANINDEAPLIMGTDTCSCCDGTASFNGVLDEISIAVASGFPWVGDRGQLPVTAANIQQTSSLWKKAAGIDSLSSANLKYRYIDLDGQQNINCKSGAVRFWFRPDWNGGTGPGNDGRLIELGDTNSLNGWWGLWVNSTGTKLTFETKSNGNLRTYFSQDVTDWSKQKWYEIALNYSSDQTQMYINGILVKTGPGMLYYPNFVCRQTNGFSIGSDRLGQLQARGTFDEFETFNCPLTDPGYTGPEITLQPTSETVCVGAAVTFRCGATGTRPLSYQWLFNGTSIPSATRSTYGFNSSSVNVGTYTVVITNQFGDITSANMSLQVDESFTVQSQSAPKIACEGDTVVLSVTTTGSGAPTSYQWKKNGSPVFESEYTGANSATLTITGVQSFDAGTYIVSVANTCTSADSSPTYLTVDDWVPALPSGLFLWQESDPNGVTQFPPGYFVANNPVWPRSPILNLPADLTGRRFEWFGNGVSQGSHVDEVLDPHSIFPPGSPGGGILQVRQVEPCVGPLSNPMVISYCEEQEDANGNVTSCTCTSPPYTDAINPSSQVVDVRSSSTATFTVVWHRDALCYNPEDDPSVTWRHNGQPINFDDQRLSASTDSSSGNEGTGITEQLTITGVKVADAGSYDVVVANGAGSYTSAPGVLIADLDIIITKQPDSQTICEGHSLSLNVEANATVPLSYQWTKNGVALPSQAASSLTINNASVEDAGTYRVFVSDPTGYLISTGAIVKILTPNDAPVICDRPLSTTAKPLTDVTFNVAPCNCIPTTFQWSKVGYGNLVDDDKYTGTQTSSLTIAGVTKPDEGTYSVILTENTGTVTTAATLFVDSVNHSPTLTNINLIREAAESGTFRLYYSQVLAASDASDPDRDPIYFKISAVRNGDLTINGLPFCPATDSSPGNCILGPNSVAMWTPRKAVPSTGTEAMIVYAFDGQASSANSASVVIAPTPKDYLLGWGTVYPQQSGDISKSGLVPASDSDPIFYGTHSGYYNYKVAPFTYSVPTIQQLAPSRCDAAVVSSDGRIWMWGFSSPCFGEGPSGTDETTWDNDIGVIHAESPPPYIYPPQKVQMFAVDGKTLRDFSNVKSVSMSADTVFAIKSDNTLWTWGDNQYGQLGYDTSGLPTRKATRLDLKDDNGNSLGIVQAVCDGTSGLALCDDGSLWWWGLALLPNYIDYIELNFFDPGNPSPAPARPQRLTDLTGWFDDVTPKPRIVQISAFQNHYMVVMDDGSMYEFGAVTLDLSQHAPPGYIFWPASVPQKPSFPPGVRITNATGALTFSLALTADGKLYRWGSMGLHNELALSTTEQPQEVSELDATRIVKIAASPTEWSSGNAFAIDENGKIWSFGDAATGLTGLLADDIPNNFSYETITPIQNPQIYRADDVAAGPINALALGARQGDESPGPVTAIPTNGAVILKWPPFAGASSYRIYRSGTSKTGYVTINDTNSNSFLDFGLTNGLKLYYEITAFVNGIESLPSDEINATPILPPSIPTWPLIDAIVAKCHTIYLQWNSDPSSVVESYKIYRSQDSGPFVLIETAPGTTTMYLDADVYDGHNYSYYVQAGNSAGSSDNSGTQSLAFTFDSSSCKPAPTINTDPAFLTIPADGEVSLNWYAYEDGNGVFPDRFRLQWFESQQPPGVSTHWRWKYVSPNGVGNYSYVLGGENELSGDKPVWIKISGFWNTEEGADSEIVGPILPCNDCDLVPPSGLVATGSDQQVYLEWNGGADPLYYELQYKPHTAPDWPDDSVAANVQTAWENRFWYSPLANQSYDFRVRTVSQSLIAGLVHSGWSTITCSTDPNHTKDNAHDFTVTADAYDSMVFLHWSGTLTGPAFVERKSAGEDWVVISGTAVGDGFQDVNVANGVTYTYRITILDAHYIRYQHTIDATPVGNGIIHVTAQPGNGYVALNWNPLFGSQFTVKHSVTKGGPYDFVTSTGGGSFVHSGLQNGIPHYYVVSAVTPFKTAVDSDEVSATPLATLAPLPPKPFSATVAGGNIIFSWAPSVGATTYRLSRAVVGDEQIYTGSLQSFIYPIPATIQAHDVLTFHLVAINQQGLESDPAEIKVKYDSDTSATQNAVLLSIGGYNVGVDSIPDLHGPTNLVLRASFTAWQDVGSAKIYFYDTDVNGQHLLGTSDGPTAEITWFHVPAGAHVVTAQAVTSANELGTGGGTVYGSAAGTFRLITVPDLAAYQTSATDLQLPAPGLSISLSRSYDSRRSDAGVLRKGWTASWDEPSLQIATSVPGNLGLELDTGWAEGGTALFGSQYMIAETTSHLITITLPGGAQSFFAPVLTAAMQNYDPVQGGPVALTFNSFTPDQGTLTCFASAGVDITSLGVNPDGEESSWGSGSFSVVQAPYDKTTDDGSDTPSPFAVDHFIYMAPDGTQYTFAPLANTWKLTQVQDRNGNTLTYTYGSSTHLLQSIRHSNGRYVQFDYDLDGNFKPTTIRVKDTAHSDPVLKYVLNAAFLEVDKYPIIGGDPERTTYNYDSSHVRVADVFDPRGVHVLHNDYHDDGSLMSQTDALGHATTYSVDEFGTLKVSRLVGGATESSSVTHDASGAISGASPSTGSGAQNVNLTYDDQGRVIGQTDASGNSTTIGYDDQNRPVSQSDANGNTTSIAFTNFNQPAISTDARGKTSSFQYDANGNPTLTTDSVGTQTSTSYYDPISANSGTAFGLVAQERKQAENVPFTIVTEYNYYAQDGTDSPHGLPGDVQSITQKWVNDNEVQFAPFIPATTYEYDLNGNRTRETKTLTVNGVQQKVSTQYIYDGQNRLIETIDPLLRSTKTKYNCIGKAAETVDALHRTNWYTYDAIGNLIETKYFDNSVTRTVYDEKNRPIWTQERAVPVGTDQLTTAPATKNIYDALGNITNSQHRSNVVLQRNTCTAALTDGSPKPDEVKVVDPGTLAYSTRTVYDVNGRVQYSMDARGAVTESLYDAAGRRTTNGVYTNYTVIPLDTGNIQPTGGFTETVYTYDSNGNQLTVTDANKHTTTYEYDDGNRCTRITYPAVGTNTSTFTTTAYDGLGQRIRQTDEAGVTTSYTYDFRGLLTSVTLDSGSDAALTTVYDYDECGNMIRQTDANNHPTQFQYDALGRRTKRILPDGSFETTEYTDVADPDGSGANVQRIATTDFRNKTIVITDDILDRVKTKVLPAVNAGENGTTIDYEYYTGSGLLQQVSSIGDTARTTGYNYDDMRRLTQKTTPEGVIRYTYTPDGQLASTVAGRVEAIDTNSDVNVDYGYDVLGRLNAVTNNLLQSVFEDHPDRIATYYTYDAVGNLKDFTYPAGVKHSYSYNEQNRLVNLTISQEGVLARSFDYTLGPTGNRTAVLEKQPSLLFNHPPLQRRHVQYEYDIDHSGQSLATPRVMRLTQEKVYGTNDNNGAMMITNYVYDKVGNRTQTINALPTQPVLAQNFRFDHRDQIDGNSIENDANDRYDANGNTIADETGAPTGDLYDAENHLIGRVRTGQPAIRIVYDHEGNRVQKTVGTTTTYYLVDDKNPTGYPHVLAEYSAPTGPADVSYVWGPSLISQTRKFSGTSFYGYDGHGSVRILFDYDFPEDVQDTYDYDTWGNIIAKTGTTLNNYTYGMYEYDSDLRMSLAGPRVFDPNLGRWHQMDSFFGLSEDPLSLHKYLYCQANPVNGIDPSGHDLISVSISCTIGASMDAIYNGVVQITGNAIQNQLIHGGNAGIYSILRDAGFIVGGMVVMKVVGGVAGAIEQRAMGPALRQELSQFTYAADYGIMEVREMNAVKAALQKQGKWPQGVEIHHLIEKRLAPKLGVAEDEIPGIVLARGPEHDQFTQAWLDQIARRNMIREPNTVTATVQDIWNAAKEVYKDYPALLEECRKFLNIK